jgi:predicted nucleic-acid-binding Zn-ribbon protein
MRFHGSRRLNFKCPKCGNTSCEVGTISTAGGFLSKVFDVQHNKFTTVTCERCKYTEIYKAESSMLGNIFDLFTN